jgi:hypothetical protein
VLAVQLALVLVYLASTGYRTLCAQRMITVFEIGQNIVAIGLFILGQFLVSPGSRRRLVPPTSLQTVAGIPRIVSKETLIKSLLAGREALKAGPSCPFKALVGRLNQSFPKKAVVEQGKVA